MPVITDLVAYYSLDEASGNAIDAHGANDLTDTNTVGTTTGKVSGARDFEFSSTEYFTIADNADLSLGSDTAFTWAGWARNEDDFQSGTDILGKWSSGGGNDGAYAIYLKPANFRYTFAIANGSSSQEISNTTVFASPANTWVYLVAWHDPTLDKIFLQADNGTPAEAAWSGGTHSTETNPFQLGRANGAFGGVWDGLLDEWGFWKGVLTSDQRTWLYNGGSGRSYADIVAEGSTSKPWVYRSYTHTLGAGLGTAK